MKKNLKLLFAGILIFMAISVSCTKDSGKGKGGSGSGDEGYISLIIQNVTDAAARADDLQENTGTAEESQLNSLRIVLYDISSGLKVKYYWDLEPADLENQTSPYQTKPEKIEKKNYKLLVLLNPTQVAKDMTVAEKAFSEFMAVRTDQTVDLLTMNSDNTERNNFMMSNWQDLVDVDKDTHIHDDENDAKTFPVTGIYVERAVAKILSGYYVSTGGRGARDASGFVTPGATVTDLQWAVDVKNKKTYLMRKTALAMVGPSGTSLVTGPEDPDPAKRHRNYAEDPNFAGFSWEDGASGPNLDAEFTRVNTATDFKTLPSVNTPGVGLGGNGVTGYGAEYVLENTMEADEQWHDVTTAILYKVKYAPDASSLERVPATDTKTIGSDKSYFVFDRYVIAADDLDDIYGGQFTIDPAKYPSIAGILTIAKLGEYKTALGMDASDTFAGFAANGTNLSQAVGTDGLQFFDAGQINYYRWPIRHYDNTIQPTKMAYRRFGVARNNIYLVHLEAINGPGTFEPKYGGPDEDMEGYISVRFEILKWVVREQGAEV